MEGLKKEDKFLSPVVREAEDGDDDWTLVDWEQQKLGSDEEQKDKDKGKGTGTDGMDESSGIEKDKGRDKVYQEGEDHEKREGPSSPPAFSDDDKEELSSSSSSSWGVEKGMKRSTLPWNVDPLPLASSTLTKKDKVPILSSLSIGAWGDNLFPGWDRRVLSDFEDFGEEEGIEVNKFPFFERDNMMEWFVRLKGPKDTLYEGGEFEGFLRFYPSYPFKPPEFQFLTPVNLHPNISKDGCLIGDLPFIKEWNPCLTALSFLTDVKKLLGAPRVEIGGSVYELNDPTTILYYIEFGGKVVGSWAKETEIRTWGEEDDGPRENQWAAMQKELELRAAAEDWENEDDEGKMDLKVPNPNRKEEMDKALKMLEEALEEKED